MIDIDGEGHGAVFINNGYDFGVDHHGTTQIQMTDNYEGVKYTWNFWHPYRNGSPFKFFFFFLGEFRVYILCLQQTFSPTDMY